MHIARQTPQELVVVSGSRWISATCAAAGLFYTYFAIVRRAPKGYFLVTVFFLLFAVIMNLHKTFTFDATRRIVRWRGRTALKSESGEIAFADIRDIGTDVNRAGQRDVPVYRLTIITPQATIPMAYAYNGQPDGYAALRQQILEFVKATS